jgi:hypothetical protein
MRVRLSVLVLAAGLFLLRAKAHADPAPRERFAFLDALPPAPLPPPEAPAPEAEEFARRPWEAFPAVGVSSPFCRGDSFGLGRCADTASGLSMGLGFAYRVTPYVALGVEGGASRFHFDPALRDGPASGASSRSNWLGAVVRGYFLERGRLDPYVQAGFGRGAVNTTYVAQGVDVEVSGAGAATMVGAGLDVWVLPYFKVGPALVYRWAFFHELRVCQAGGCAGTTVGDGGAVGSDVGLRLVGTFALGREM